MIDYTPCKRWIESKFKLKQYFSSLPSMHTICSALGIQLKYSGYFAMIPENFDIDSHLKQHPLTNYMFVRDNAGHIRSVARNGGVGSSLYFDKERLIYIIGLISSIPARNKDSITDDGFVIINSTLIRNAFKDYLSYLDYLILTGVLCTDGQYIQGDKSKGYKFTHRYANVPLKRYNYSAFQIADIAPFQSEIYSEENNGFIPNPVLAYPYLFYWYSTKGLQVDKEKAIQYAYFIMQDKLSKGELAWDINRDKSHTNIVVYKNPVSQYHAALHNINSIDIKDYRVIIDSNVHRLHSVITNLQKVYRRFLTYNGEKLVNIDISNSQPYLLCLLLNPLFWDRNSDIPLNIGMLHQNVQELFDDEHLNEIREYVETLQANDNTILNNYIQTASQGKIYEYMMDVINKKQQSELTRDDIKTMILTTLFSKNRFMPTYKRYFRQSFSQIYGLMELIKRENHAALACLLQNMESKIILHRCCSKIWEDGRMQIPVFTIHDSICTTVENEGFVKNIMLSILTESIGIAPNIKIEVIE